jgi:glutamate---cysteine ligase / carboxylate-amine ligase
VYQMLEDGTGADRQLKVFQESGGDMKAVVDYMIQQTMEGVVEPATATSGSRC